MIFDDEKHRVIYTSHLSNESDIFWNHDCEPIGITNLNNGVDIFIDVRTTFECSNSKTHLFTVHETDDSLRTYWKNIENTEYDDKKVNLTYKTNLYSSEDSNGQVHQVFN